MINDYVNTVCAKDKINITVLGDSHMRNFFDTVNHLYEKYDDVDGFRIIDPCGNTMAGGTIWGLLNEGSETDARNKIKKLLDTGHDNVALLFGEVDCRWHIHSNLNGRTMDETVAEVVDRYEKFIKQDVIQHVRGKLIIYFTHAYAEDYFKTVSGDIAIKTKESVLCLARHINNMCIKNGWHAMTNPEFITSAEGSLIEEYDPKDGDTVHLLPKAIFRNYVLPKLKDIFSSELKSDIIRI